MKPGGPRPQRMKKGFHMKITITDIARDTGLAVSTISKYLNHKNILPENEALIEASIKKLGYTPNRIAQDFPQIGVEAARLLLEQFQNPENFSPQICQVPVQLIERESVCNFRKELP